jgi:steroid delta-isomerase-like uncharacterized protein
MSTEQNKTVVRRFFDEVCNQRKLEIADELVAATHTLHDPSIPGAKPGPKGLAQTIATYQNAFNDAHWAVEEVLAENDKVVVRWTGHGTHTGELPGIPPTGKRVTVPGVWIFRIAGGQIAESWDVWDTMGMLQQLGVIPAPGQ